MKSPVGCPLLFAAFPAQPKRTGPTGPGGAVQLKDHDFGPASPGNVLPKKALWLMYCIPDDDVRTCVTLGFVTTSVPACCPLLTARTASSNPHRRWLALFIVTVMG